jgi:hypothetical protein
MLTPRMPGRNCDGTTRKQPGIAGYDNAPLAQATQDRDGVHDVGLGDQDLLETPLKRWVL